MSFLNAALIIIFQTGFIYLLIYMGTNHTIKNHPEASPELQLQFKKMMYRGAAICSILIIGAEIAFKFWT